MMSPVLATAQQEDRYCAAESEQGGGGLYEVPEKLVKICCMIAMPR